MATLSIISSSSIWLLKGAFLRRPRKFCASVISLSELAKSQQIEPRPKTPVIEILAFWVGSVPVKAVDVFKYRKFGEMFFSVGTRIYASGRR